MNLLDAAIIIVVGALVALGFFGGIMRIVAGMLAFYVSTIVAAAFYEELGEWLADSVADMRLNTANLIAFLILFVGLGIAFMWAIGVTIKAVEVRRGRLAILNNVGGAALGVLAATLAIAVTLSVSVVILGAFNQASQTSGTEGLGTFGEQIRESALVPIFLKLQEPISTSFEPWFPDGLPPILEPTDV